MQISFLQALLYYVIDWIQYNLNNAEQIRVSYNISNKKLSFYYSIYSSSLYYTLYFIVLFYTTLCHITLHYINIIEEEKENRREKKSES